MPRLAFGTGQLEGHGPGQLTARSGEGVRQRAPREPGDGPQPVRGHELHIDRVGDVTGVDPGLGQARGGQCVDRELTGDPGDTGVRVRVTHQRGERGGGAQIPIVDRRGPDAALRVDHQPRALVDVARRPVVQRSTAPSTSGSRPCALPIAISFVWARCNTTSAADQPSQGDGRAQSDGVDPVEHTRQLGLLFG